MLLQMILAAVAPYWAWIAALGVGLVAASTRKEAWASVVAELIKGGFEFRPKPQTNPAGVQIVTIERPRKEPVRATEAQRLEAYLLLKSHAPEEQQRWLSANMAALIEGGGA